jgi:hypothetical protein
MKRSLVTLAVLLAAGLPALAEDYEVQMKDRTHGCRSPEETYRFWSLARHDKEAAARYSNEKGCRLFEKGETVAVVERDVFAKINGVRPKGEKIVYFVPAADAN